MQEEVMRNEEEGVRNEEARSMINVKESSHA
jgi:hypothetical protein